MKHNTIISILIALMVSSCGSNTRITGAWKNPKKPKAYAAILVAALTENVNAKQTVENDLASVLSRENVKALKSIDVFPVTFSGDITTNKDAMLDKIRTTDAEAILTISLINTETENRYVPGTYGYEPVTRFNYYGLFSGYYTYWYPRVYTPGYYTEEKTYFIETNLYDAKTEELMWSAQSETYNLGTLQAFSMEYSRLVVNKLQEDGIVLKQ